MFVLFHIQIAVKAYKKVQGEAKALFVMHVHLNCVTICVFPVLAGVEVHCRRCKRATLLCVAASQYGHQLHDYIMGGAAYSLYHVQQSSLAARWSDISFACVCALSCDGRGLCRAMTLLTLKKVHSTVRPSRALTK